MFEVQTPRARALKLAPWWKRLLAYFLDNIFLYFVLTILISGLFGQEIQELVEESRGQGLELLSKFSENNDHIAAIKQMSPTSQDMIYLIYMVRMKYSTFIFFLLQIISSLYFFVFWMISGQTFGASLMKIKVISPIGFRPSPLSILLRVIGLKFIEFSYGFTALIIFNPILKQRVHDSISQTAVIEEFSEEDEAEILKNEKLMGDNAKDIN